MDYDINVFDSVTVLENITDKYLSYVWYVDYVNGNSANDGKSWATAKQRLGDIASPARNDIIKIAKSPDAVDSGVNCTFTEKNAVLTLASAVTKTVDDCNNAWTPSTNVTQASDTTNFKQGASARSLAIATAFTTGLVAYRALGSVQDFSAYSKLTFWIRSSTTVQPNYLKMSLCSDTAGATPVDDFTIPYVLYSGEWYAITLPRDGGGSLSNSIQSVALYGLVDLPSVTIILDNIEACNDISLNSLLGKSNTDTLYSKEGWWSPKSIVGTSIVLAGNQNQGSDATRANVTPYYGKTETVSLYYRNPTPVLNTHIGSGVSSGQFFVMNASGQSQNYIWVQGGWNTSTDQIDGMTIIDGINGFGYFVYSISRNFVRWQNLGCVRFGFGYSTSGSYNTWEKIYMMSTSQGAFGLVNSGAQLADDPFATLPALLNRQIKAIQNGSTTSSVGALPSPTRMLWDDCVAYPCNNHYGIYATSNQEGCFFNKVICKGITYGVYGSTGIMGMQFDDCEFVGDSGNIVYISQGGIAPCVFRNCYFEIPTVSVSAFIYVGGTTFQDFYKCTFVGGIGAGEPVQNGTYQPNMTRFYNCTFPANMKLQMQNSSGTKWSRVESYNHNQSGVPSGYNIVATTTGRVVPNTVEGRNAPKPCVEIHKVSYNPSHVLEAEFVAPMTAGQARTLKIWLKRSLKWYWGRGTYAYDKWGSIYIGAKVGDAFVVDPTDIHEQVHYGIWTQHTVIVPSDKTYDGVIKLVVGVDVNGGSGETADFNRVYCDDFQWS